MPRSLKKLEEQIAFGVPVRVFRVSRFLMPSVTFEPCVLGF